MSNRQIFEGSMDRPGQRPENVRLNVVSVYTNPVRTFTDTDATPDVVDGSVFITEGTTNITDFDGGVVGQTIKILAGASITIEDSAAINLSGGANYAMTVGDTLTLTMYEDQVWYEDARSVN